MKVQIHHKNLSDSPFNESNKGLFSFDNPNIDQWALDLITGKPTCYLVSGYRGAGKTSFITKLESRIEEIAPKKEKDNLNNTFEIVFVHINFSRYEKQTYLLRKLIRGLYLKLDSYDSFKSYKEGERNLRLNQRPIQLLEELYEKTFYEVSQNSHSSTKTDVVMSYNFKLWPIIELIGGILLTIALALNVFKNVPSLIYIAGALSSVVLSIKGGVDMQLRRTKNSSEQQDFNRKSMYDDEIADHHFFNSLKMLEEKKYKVVFVLDELDKVADEEVEALLREMKPYLVSGRASFIVVAGQNLYYRYLLARSIDDDVLASVFSKVVHLPLHSRSSFIELFKKKLMVEEQVLSKEDEKVLDGYIDFLVFEAKGIPRKFISLIRKDITWEEAKSFLEIERSAESYSIYSQVLNVAERVQEGIESEDFEEGIKDYFVMQLYIVSHKILFSRKHNFSYNDLFN